ncbi:S9 family peptidase [Pontibacter sp. BT310]|uniref:S9 family peptidase n=1 Tax=Pontibacter populi TaxID=890055 RepID=A0ABS6X904_9BACT|nr:MULTISPECIES: S9 family peptidase [Pontibacter]MBJ6117493.1 S9 family peptidase [Pontibacter sp. BT310]MBR0569918.1 S9 family peptidase [Microvirga sp. STS03]MBW3364346.1 S9 family peptidase [Pontibacter populi]
MHIKLRSNLLAAMLLCFAFVAQAQQKKDITLEDIYRKGTFRAQSVYGVNWMKDGQYYSSTVADEKNKVADIVKYDVTTGKPVSTIIEGENLKPEGSNTPIQFDNYTFSSDEQKVLFSTGTEQIYRRSSKAEFYIYDLASKKLTKLSNGGKQLYATFSPDAKRVAFARDNNMFVTDLSNMKETQITTDGKFNSIINGSADWVYEEEFSFAQGFHWSPDGKKIAFYTFDETNVPEFNMQMWGELYPQDNKFKYPKPGEANSKVKVSVYDVASAKTVKMDTGNEADIYIPRIKWTNNPNLLSIQKMNRLQNTLEILHANATTGKADVVLKETDKAYIDITDDLTYLKDGKHFIHSSEVKGFNHLYLYNMNGKLVRQITNGNWEVSSYEGYDEKNDRLYYMSTEVSPLERHLYSISSKGKNKKRLTTTAGTHRVNLSNDFKYFLDYSSAANQVPVVALQTAKDGKLIKTLEDNQKLKNTLDQFNIAKQEFFTMKTADGTQLNGWMIKPTDFDPNKKYPVLMFVYGGPGSQTVTNSWGGTNYLWYQVLASKGMIVVSVDNRGTGARGAEFKKTTYANLGKYEIEDQIEAAKWLGNQNYVDKNRIGIWGHSYGGYMTLLGLTKGNGVFAAGISVAPVTNWRYYDTIYTERFLKTPQENAAGYDDNSPLFFADKLQGELLLIHGTGDDNVHFQNAVAMQDALISANKQFESFYYPNRNHGVGGGITSLHRFTMMTDFLERKLINSSDEKQNQ